MSAPDPTVADRPRPTVFLSYASEDRPAAQRIRDALPAYGLEVWYDESELVGGDAWDQKIRRQIRECDYFMPVISAQTEARHEGYFRREWRLAVERTLDMADDHVFLLPVVIDATSEAGARVPEKFRAVQWLRAPDGQPTAALEAVCRRLVSGQPQKPSRDPLAKPAMTGAAAQAPDSRSGQPPPAEPPPFPREEPGQRVRFWFQVVGWVLQSAWGAFKRLPKWVRISAYVWLIFVVVTRGCATRHDDRPPPVSHAQSEKLKEIAASHSRVFTPAEIAQLSAEIAQAIPAAAEGASSKYSPMLAIPFGAASGSTDAQKLAGSAFTQIYGRLVIARHGRVSLSSQPLSSPDTAAAAAQGRAHHSAYVVYGTVSGQPPKESLDISIVDVDDASVSWSKSYPVSGSDPASIAAQVSAEVSSVTDD